MLNLKDLPAPFPPKCRATFSGFVWQLKRGGAYLLIPGRLLAELLRKTSKGLVNLKGLPTSFLPRLRGLFENSPARRRSFGDQIVPNFAIFDRKRAANGVEQGGERLSLVTEFTERRPSSTWDVKP